MTMANEYSADTLFHFTCDNCTGWWSVALDKITISKWHCTWCGSINEYKSFYCSRSERAFNIDNAVQADWVEDEITIKTRLWKEYLKGV